MALKLPAAVLRPDGTTKFVVRPIFAADIEAKPDGSLVVAEDPEWPGRGFPTMWPLKLVKVGQKDNRTTVELQPDNGSMIVKLNFAAGTDPLKALPAVVLLYPDEPLQKQRYIESVYSILAKRYFTGALAGLDEIQQRSLLAFAHVTANGTTLGSEVYKDKTYLVVDLGSDTVQYNDLKFTPASLVAHVVNDKLLTILKAFAKPVEGALAVHGLKLSFKIPHRDFLRETAPNESTLVIYAPSADIKKFAEAEITSQQLIDASVVIMDNNRIQVPLAGM